MLSEDLRDEEKRAARPVANGATPEAVEVARDSMKLQLEVRRLDRIMRKASEVMFGAMEAQPDGSILMSATDAAGITSEVIAALGETLRHSTNYTQIGGWHPELGRIECIVQRVGKLSPHEARDEAERHLGRAVALLRQHGIEWDGPTTFPPDEPPSRAVPADAERSWLVVDANVQPNDLLCQRCARRQRLPPRITSAIFTAMVAAFKEQHADCQEGDAEIGRMEK
jgi:hypothetical protein